MKRPTQKAINEVRNGRKPTKDEINWALKILSSTDWKLTKKEGVK